MKLDLVLAVLPWVLFSQKTLAGHLVGRQSSTTSCASGNTYLVVPGDDCQKISLAKSVSTRALIASNNIDSDCSNLIAGEQICLPPSCSARQVQVGDTCFSIAVATLTTTTALSSLNPGLDSTCSNLIGGEVLCVGPAGGNGTTTSCVTGGPGPTGTTGHTGPTGTAPTTATTTASSATTPVAPSGSGSVSAVVSPPAPTSPGTASECFRYHTVVSGDYCNLLGGLYAITFDQLRQLNPDLNAECTNLLLGVAYCVSGKAQGTTATGGASLPIQSTNARKRWIARPHAHHG